MRTETMIASHPDVRGSINANLIRCIDECYACMQACLSCADSCLAEAMVQELRQCIRFNLDCGDVCETVARLAGRRTGSDTILLSQMLKVCEVACRQCAEECDRHAEQHEHCRICAEACRECELACRNAAPTIRAGETERAH